LRLCELKLRKPTVAPDLAGSPLGSGVARARAEFDRCSAESSSSADIHDCERYTYETAYVHVPPLYLHAHAYMQPYTQT